jgi:multisubunit Na+/H+ antiporter MnhB subunit
MTPTAGLDIGLGLALVVLAIAALSSTDLFRGVVLFIAFGLLMALAWTRLHAVDIALAEAAIGAGVTGAMFLNTLAHVAPGDHSPHPATSAGPSRASRAASVLLLSGLVVVLGGLVWDAPREFAGLARHVEAELPRSGAANPVTAVLLNFRGYDTLLEVGVLLLAAVGVWSLGAAGATAGVVTAPGPVLIGFVRLLAPVMVVVAGYVLWIGSKAPGGAFQSAAVLTAAGILLLVTGLAFAPSPQQWLSRVAVSAGLVVFLAVALGATVAGGRFLEYPPEWAGTLILLIEISLAVSTAVVLVVLFAGAPPEPQSAE